MTIQKIGFITGWFSFIVLEVLVTVGLALITLSPAGLVENKNLIWLCIGLALAFVLQTTLIRFREARKIRDASITGNSDIWSTISDFRQLIGFIKAVGIALLALVGTVVLTYLFQRKWVTGQLHVTTPFMAYVAGFLVYWIVAMPIISRLKNKLGTGPSSGGFQCTITGQTISLTLPWLERSKTGNYSFNVDLNEVNELRIFENYAERLAYYQRNIESNVPLISQNVMNTAKWFTKKIARPEVYIQSAKTNLTCCLIRGPQLFLFIELLPDSVGVLKLFEKG